VQRRPALSIAAVVALATVSSLSGCGGRAVGKTNAAVTGTRATTATAIDARSAPRLVERWRFAFRERPGYAGIYASTPVADAANVYVQDLQSNVYALDRLTGTLRWEKRYRAPNEGPNGLFVDTRRVYGATDSDAFALSVSSGRELWRRHLTSAHEPLINIAPVAWHGLVFVSTVGYPPGGRGAIYALDAATGVVRWKFVTIERPWRFPGDAGGGGLWYPVSIVARGVQTAGRSPAPFPTPIRCSCSTRGPAICAGTTR
jgi:hypothetical protein